ncbi:unnamed protein product [Brassica oleracea]
MGFFWCVALVEIRSERVHNCPLLKHGGAVKEEEVRHCDSEFVAYGSYFNVFVSTLATTAINWIASESSTDEKDLDNPHDVFADTDLDLQACSLCQKLDDMKKKKVLGICFDQQSSVSGTIWCKVLDFGNP